MKIPYSSIEFGKNKYTIEEIAEKLSLAGFLVEDINKNVLDIEVTANRGDVLSVLGICRELAAILEEDFSITKINIPKQKLNFPLKIDINDKEICPRYTYRIITGIKVGESSDWLKDELAKFDFRSVSNIVDVTNYVMMEMGQPLHAFDYDKLGSKKEMIIRRARKGEEITTLDSKTHKLSDQVIVIENNKKLIDLVGIMGGKNSEVDNNTKTIILQAALFDSTLIRRTSKKLNFTTDASYRYERGIDPEGAKLALDRATAMILELAGGKAGKIIDIVSQSASWQKKIKINFNQINHLLGIYVPKEKIIKILKRLGFKIILNKSNSQKADVEVPSWRLADIDSWQDIAEEIIRIYGYLKIPKKVLSKEKPVQKNKEFIIKQKLANLLTKVDFIETLGYSFLSGNDLKAAGINLKNCLEIKNPLSSQFQYLRTSLMPGILRQISKNPWSPEINIFEIGKIYLEKNEQEKLILATTQKSKIFNNILEIIKKEFSLKNLSYRVYDSEKKVLDYFKIRRNVQIMEIDIQKIFEKAVLKSLDFKVSDYQIKFKEISKYPPVVRDLAFILNQDISALEVKDEIKKIDPSIFIIDLFDEFSSDKFGPGKKNLAFHIWFSDLNKTLSDIEVEKIIKKITHKIGQKYQAKLRDF